MKIYRMNKLEGDKGGKISAFFDVETEDGFIIKGFRLINGSNGMFMAPPNEKGKDEKYYDSVIVPKEKKSELEKLALDEYGKG